MIDALFIAVLAFIVLGPDDIPRIVSFFARLKHKWNMGLSKYCGLSYHSYHHTSVSSSKTESAFVKKLPYAQTKHLQYATRRHF